MYHGNSYLTLPADPLLFLRPCEAGSFKRTPSRSTYHGANMPQRTCEHKEFPKRLRMSALHEVAVPNSSRRALPTILDVEFRRRW